MVSLFQEYAGHLAAWIPIALGVIGTASMAILLVAAAAVAIPKGHLSSD